MKHLAVILWKVDIDFLSGQSLDWEIIGESTKSLPLGFFMAVVQYPCSGPGDASDCGSFPTASKRSDCSSASCSNAYAFGSVYATLVFHRMTASPMVFCSKARRCRSEK